VIKNKSSDIVRPGSVKTVVYMGLPLFNNPALNGNLFVHFEIDFPKKLSADQLESIQKVLSFQKPKSIENLGLEYTHECVPFNKSHINENKKERNEAYNDDEGQENDGFVEGGQRVKCQNQ